MTPLRRELYGFSMSNKPVQSVISRAQEHGNRTAIVDAHGDHTYADLLFASEAVATALLADKTDLQEERIAFLVTPSFTWVAVLWGIWRAGGIAVPLAVDSPLSELDYVISDTRAFALVADEGNKSVLAPLAEKHGIALQDTEGLLTNPCSTLPLISPERRAMILYTSGTTSRPKGVVTSHANIAAQITTLIDAWEWSHDDRIPLFLPLHHVHGIINIVSCALWAGAICEMMPRFDALTVWDRIGSGQLTLLMAVPTIYFRLVAAWESFPHDRRAFLSKQARKLRLMVSGSAALPVSTLERWREITGHTLLERYGMTEIGMALSNPYHGERVPGSVGRPLPGVDVRLIGEKGEVVCGETPGEIEVRGGSVFQEYWGKPEVTIAAFHDGWFRTGDTAAMESGVYRILGRSNIDILKTGAHKVSALEIEEVLREHPEIRECAVVGIPDQEWGERVAAAIVVQQGCTLELDALRSWAKERLATHKVPSRLVVVDSLPRNAMGKVTKPAVKDLFTRSDSA